ncbi:MAG: hypothetical protein RIS35_1202 [Pseudomonadota bacterium]|jgi:hypothetical protein
MQPSLQSSTTPLNERVEALEKWLLEHVTAAYDALKADPSRAVGVDAVKARLAAAAWRAKSAS